MFPFFAAGMFQSAIRQKSEDVLGVSWCSANAYAFRNGVVQLRDIILTDG